MHMRRILAWNIKIWKVPIIFRHTYFFYFIIIDLHIFVYEFIYHGWSHVTQLKKNLVITFKFNEVSQTFVIF